MIPQFLLKTAFWELKFLGATVFAFLVQSGDDILQGKPKKPRYLKLPYKQFLLQFYSLFNMGGRLEVLESDLHYY